MITLYGIDMFSQRVTRRRVPCRPQFTRTAGCRRGRPRWDLRRLIIQRMSVVLFCFLSFHCFPSVALAQTSEKELFLVAQKAFDDGFYDVAIRYIEEYLEKYPQTQKRIEANLLLGQCYFFKTQYLKAFNIFQDLLKYSEFKDATLFWLGETYLKGSDYAQAEKYYRQLIELYPDSLIPRRLSIL